MTRNVFLSVTKFFFILSLLFPLSSLAQKEMKPRLPGNNYKNFLKTQWWLGLKSGVTLTNPNPRDAASSIEPIDYDISELDKSYDGIVDHSGMFIGLDFGLYHKGFTLNLEPNFKQLTYGYSTNFNWIGEEPEQTFNTVFTSRQKLNLIEIPTTLTVDLISKKKVRPFVGGGIAYSFIIGTEKDNTLTHTDNTSGSPRTQTGEQFVITNSDQFKGFFSYHFGGGIGFDYFNIKTIIDVFYHRSLTKVNNTNNRFDVNELTTIGDISDDIKLDHLSISIGFVFPMRYLEKPFQPY